MKPGRFAKVTVYRSYRFITKDPLCDALRTMIRSEEHLNNNQVHAISGVAAQTVHGWLDGGTRRPQNASTSAVAGALGYVRRDYFDRQGHLVIAFVKDRQLDYKQEMEKQADWILKHSGKPKKKKRKKKANGNEK